MSTLTLADTQRLLTAIAELHSDLRASTLAERSISSVGTLISNDLLAFDKFSASDEFIENSWNSAPGLMTPEMYVRFAEIIGECPDDNPLMKELLASRHSGALKISDFVSDRDFQRTRMYNEFLRDVGGAHMLAVILPVSDAITISCAINRDRSDFSEHDRMMLSLLQPHLTAAVRNSLEYSRLSRKERLLERLLDRTTRARIVVDSQGQILYDSGEGRSLLAQYDRSSSFNSSLPETVHAWMSRSLALSPLERSEELVLTIEGETSQLKLMLSVDLVYDEHTLLLREIRMISPRLLRGLGLTRREAEVLYWISEGKTDQIIATLLCISRRTVNKHVENILFKLAVETRTAAVSRAMRLLESQGI